MLLSKFRELTKDLSGDSEIVMWCYFDVLDEDGSILDDASQGITDFTLDINKWIGDKHSLHFTVKGQDVYDQLKATIN